jgi:hypothetical protein
MNALTGVQKLILIVLAIIDVAVIAVMGSVVIASSRAPASVIAPTQTATAFPSATLPATWTPTPTTTPVATLPSRATTTPSPTPTAYPTYTPIPATITPTLTITPTPVPPRPVRLEGADFDYIMPNRIPGWTWDAFVNYKPGDAADPEKSYAEPYFESADDPERQIQGNTLKVETVRWLKFRTWVHQTVTVTAGSQVQFQIQAKAYSSLDALIVKAGIDPTGSGNCFNASWGSAIRINQDSGTVLLTSPLVTAPRYIDPNEIVIEAPPDDMDEEDLGDERETAPPEVQLGRVTVCFFAEPTYPHINNAAFFDVAKITVRPPR